MAKLYITEFKDYQRDGAVGMGLAKLPAITTQVLTISGSNAKSAALNANTRFVRVHTDAICHITAGDDPTATTGDARLAADQTEYFGVVPGQKLAVIAGT